MAEAPPNRLKELRTGRNLRSVHVAAAIDKDQTAIWRYETCRVPIPDDVKQQLADYFEVSIPHLMRWDEETAA